MNSYDEEVIESCWNVIGLWELSADDRDIGDAIGNLKTLITNGPDEFESEI